MDDGCANGEYDCWVGKRGERALLQGRRDMDDSCANGWEGAGLGIGREKG